MRCSTEHDGESWLGGQITQNCWLELSSPTTAFAPSICSHADRGSLEPFLLNLILGACSWLSQSGNHHDIATLATDETPQDVHDPTLGHALRRLQV